VEPSPVNTPVVLRCPASGITKSISCRFISGFAYSLIGAVASQGGVFLSTIIIARLLGKDTFGQLGAVQNSLITFFNVSTIGVGITATRYVAALKASERDYLGRILSLCLLAAGVSGGTFSIFLFLFAKPIALFMLGAPALAVPLRIGAAYCALMTLNTFYAGTLLGFESFTRLLRQQVVQGTATVTAATILTLALGLNGAAASYPLAAAVTCVYGRHAFKQVCYRAKIHLGHRNLSSAAGVFRTFVAPSVTSGLLFNGAIWLSHAYLARQPGGFSQIGLFVAADQLRRMILLAPRLLNRVTGPILTSLWSQRLMHYKRTFWRAAGTGTLMAVAGSVATCLLYPLLMRLFGRGFTGAGVLVLVLSISTVIEVYATSVYQAIYSAGRMRYQALVACVWTAVMVSSSTVAVPRYGATGLASAYLISWFVAAIVYSRVAQRLTARAEQPAPRESLPGPEEYSAELEVSHLLGGKELPEC